MSTLLENAKLLVTEAKNNGDKELSLQHTLISPTEKTSFLKKPKKTLSNTELRDLLIHINKEIPDLKKLTINAIGSPIIPKEIGLLKELKYLDISENPNLKKISDTIQNLEHLESLDLSKTKLSKLPKSVTKLSKLRKLYIVDCKLNTLPKQIGNLKELRSLLVYKNKIKALPSSIGSLTNLKVLNARNNRLREVPDAIGNLKNIEILLLSDNLIKKIPNVIHKLDHLKKLTLDDNWLQTLPSRFSIPNSLQHLSLDFNFLNREAINQINNLRTSSNTEIIYTDRRGLSRLRENIEIIFVNDEKINKIYGTFYRRFNRKKVYLNGRNEKISDEQVVMQFIKNLPLQSTGDLQEMYIDSARSLIEELINKKTEKDTLAKIATALGDCATPVVNFLIQHHIGVASNDGIMSTTLNNLLEREALEKSLTIALGGQGNNTKEFIEKVNGFVNFIYAPDETRNAIVGIHNYILPIYQENPRHTIDSKTSNYEYAYLMAKQHPADMEKFAEICCKVDDTNTLIVNDYGQYIVDPIKLIVLKEKYCQNLGITTPIGSCINNFETGFNDLLSTNEKAQNLICTQYDNPEVSAAIDTNTLKNTLRIALLSEDPSNYEEHTNEFVQQCKDRIMGIEVIDNQKEDSISIKSTTINTTKSSRRRSRTRSRGV
ncbi:leucine-rich repeat domain-containing protein [Aquimarina sp. W85]|uniref:leucine-rich repeat domain-containing protein n=1 Tax=Aquimarina rhodophyticola TaxID=3342246 RepID=UPI00366E10F5